VIPRRPGALKLRVGPGAINGRARAGPRPHAPGALVSFFGFKKKDTTLSVPGGMTGRYNFQNPQDVTIRAADEARGAGATGSRSSTPSPRNSDKWVAQNVVLRWAP
jgi:hypothetical protein